MLRRIARDTAPEDSFVIRQHSCRREVLLPSFIAALPHRLPFLRGMDHSTHRICNPLCIERINEQSCFPILDYFSAATKPCCDHWLAAAHCLKQYEAKCLGFNRKENADIAAAEISCSILLCAEKQYRLRNAELACQPNR